MAGVRRRVWLAKLGTTTGEMWPDGKEYAAALRVRGRGDGIGAMEEIEWRGDYKVGPTCRS